VDIEMDKGTVSITLVAAEPDTVKMTLNNSLPLILFTTYSVFRRLFMVPF
jgi:hypothetical protein